VTDEEIIREHWRKVPPGWSRNYGGVYRVPVAQPLPLSPYDPSITASTTYDRLLYAVEYRHDRDTGKITGEYGGTKLTLLAGTKP
jgi:hypothetical protein